MQLLNSTDFPDAFLRRMVSWCAGQVDYPVRRIRQARFARARNRYSGRAYGERRFSVRVGLESEFSGAPHKHKHAGFETIFADRIEALVHITAHELEHLSQYARKAPRRRGFYEHGAERAGVMALDAFRADREAILAAWSDEPPKVAVGREAKPSKPRLSIVEQRAIAADKKLTEWTRKLKLAQTKVKVYKKKVGYYAKRQAACPGPDAK